MAYWQLFYHIVWATKYREPTITPKREEALFNFIRSKAYALGGTVHALNGTVDHVHLVASIPPKIAIARFVGQVKGVSSARYNEEVRQDLETRFYWQESYGIFSFDKKRLPYIVEYVCRQKEHHQDKQIIPILEKDVEDDDSQTIIAEGKLEYLTDYERWFSSMMGYIKARGRS